MLGAILGLSPTVLELEETIGLGWLFALRGAARAPDQVVVVSVSAESAAALGQPAELDEWPRSLHAELIDRLVDLGAEVIVFDVIFDKPRVPEHDRLLAAAIHEAGNVILLERVQSEIIAVTGANAPANAVMEIRVPPIPQFKQGALASAPFTVPVVPIRVGQFWTFGRAAGDTPSLPVAALQAYLLPLYDDFITGLAAVYPELTAQLPKTENELIEAHDLEAIARILRGAFQRDRLLAPKLLEQLRAQQRPIDQEALLEALVRVYAGKGSRYLNYYGPARTIRTIPYHEILQSSPDSTFDVEGRVVFVGFSERRQPEQQDAFYSVFSERSGQNLSGVEIGATAFANLLEQRAVVPLSIPAYVLAVFVWGLSLGMILVSLSPAPAIAAAFCAGALYGAAALWAFRIGGLWLPIVTPLLVQLPVVLVAASIWNYHRVRLQRERIRTALGYYVPARMANRLAHESLIGGASAELLHGTCLFTDAEQYTAVAESMRPAELGQFMNEYYQAMFKAVDRHNGQVADVAGDSMVAIWAAVESEPRCRIDACRAALDVLAAVDEFNRNRGRHGLPTRVGLDSGQVLLGNIGAGHRYEYRAVGDIVSTASRIQGLNRLLGTQILVSGATLADIGGFLSRDVGTFLLRGKTTALLVHELRNVIDVGRATYIELSELFSAALESFRLAHWTEAERRFRSVLERFPEDGPSRYYLELCAQYRAREPANWNGVVAVAVK
jgi:adenylate cyclase